VDRQPGVHITMVSTATWAPTTIPNTFCSFISEIFCRARWLKGGSKAAVVRPCRGLLRGLGRGW
jgi:hypothetical protein